MKKREERDAKKTMKKNIHEILKRKKRRGEK